MVSRSASGRSTAATRRLRWHAARVHASRASSNVRPHRAPSAARGVARRAERVHAGHRQRERTPRCDRAGSSYGSYHVVAKRSSLDVPRTLRRRLDRHHADVALGAQLEQRLGVARGTPGRPTCARSPGTSPCRGPSGAAPRGTPSAPDSLWPVMPAKRTMPSSRACRIASAAALASSSTLEIGDGVHLVEVEAVGLQLRERLLELRADAVRRCVASSCTRRTARRGRMAPAGRRAPRRAPYRGATSRWFTPRAIASAKDGGRRLRVWTARTRLRRGWRRWSDAPFARAAWSARAKPTLRRL